MMNTNVHLHRFESSQDLAENLAQKIVQNLQNAIDSNGKASLIVSGGSTPKLLFEKLSAFELDWEKVRVGLCDERWIAPTHTDSNERLVKSTLLQNEAAKATFVGTYREGVSAFDAELLCSQNVEQKLLPLDVVVLGMGSDAHTASLFPENPKLVQGLDLSSSALCIAIEPASAPYMRMSLTRRAILDAAHIYLHFEGREKFAVYEEAMRGEDMITMPIRSILKQNEKNVEVYYA